MPMNLEVAARYADLVPGAADVVRRLREFGLKMAPAWLHTRHHGPHSPGCRRAGI